MAKIKRERIKYLVDKVDSDCSNIIEIVNEITEPYKDSITKLMKEYRTKLKQRGKSLTIDELNYAIASLPVEAYFIIDGVTDLSIKEDICSAIRNEIYNKVNVEEVGTVDERRSKAELKVMEETIIHTAYRRAKEDLKERLKLAYESLNSFKKVLQSKENEKEVIRGGKN